MYADIDLFYPYFQNLSHDFQQLDELCYSQTPSSSLMTAEYHAPSPLMPTQQSCFARYCKQLSPMIWLIVDNSLESIMIDNPLINSKRRPSGCLIQDSLDGTTTKVTWIEHVEFDVFMNPLFKSIIDDGLLVSAKHWVDTLVRQSQQLDYVLQHTSDGLYKELSPFQVEGLLRLSKRMRREFYGVLSSTKRNNYKPIMSISGGENILIKTLNGDHDHDPTVITIATSTWFSFPQKKIFHFLSNEKSRLKWDVLALGHDSEEIFHVHSSQGSEDIVSITKMVDKKGRMDTLFLKEKHETSMASYVMFSPITYDSIVSLNSHGNIDEIPLLPSGFAILSGQKSGQVEVGNGSLVTLVFQLLDSSSRSSSVIPTRTLGKLCNLVKTTVSSINVALLESSLESNIQDETVESCMCLKRNRPPNETHEDDRWI